jgi:hypothetical protein
VAANCVLKNIATWLSNIYDNNLTFEFTVSIYLFSSAFKFPGNAKLITLHKDENNPCFIVFLFSCFWICKASAVTEYLDAAQH